MKTCGIELKGNDAIIACVEGEKNNYSLILSEIKKIGLKDSLDQDEVRSFYTRMNAFLEENNFDKVIIKARATKGRFSGGSVSFKMEALIQNTDAVVLVVAGATIKAKMKNHEKLVDSSAVNSYQEDALSAAIYAIITA